MSEKRWVLERSRVDAKPAVAHVDRLVFLEQSPHYLKTEALRTLSDRGPQMSRMWRPTYLWKRGLSLLLSLSSSRLLEARTSSTPARHSQSREEGTSTQRQRARETKTMTFRRHASRTEASRQHRASCSRPWMSRCHPPFFHRPPRQTLEQPPHEDSSSREVCLPSIPIPIPNPKKRVVGEEASTTASRAWCRVHLLLHAQQPERPTSVLAVARREEEPAPARPYLQNASRAHVEDNAQRCLSRLVGFRDRKETAREAAPRSASRAL
jgi:hypothetical protein